MKRRNKGIIGLSMLVLFFLSASLSSAQEKFLPFLDDFSSYEGVPNVDLWVGENCFVNHNYQYLPPSVGVVTLDAVDREGNLYPGANSLGFVGDTLCSVYIRLDSLNTPSKRALTLADSIYLSFFVQPGGGMGELWERIGSQPSTKDSLVLQFYCAEDNSWNDVWSMRGTGVDSIFASDSSYFRYVLIPINESKYLNKFFKFRFLNYASLDSNPDDNYVINCDQWNIDYVYIDCNRTCEDRVFNDIAFVNPAASLLKNFTSVPYKQYLPSMMKDSLDMKIINLSSNALSSSYKYEVKDGNSNIIASYDGGFENISPFISTLLFQESENHSKPPVQFAFPAMAQPTDFTITHIVQQGVGQDDLSANDTVVYHQIFSDFFAYDDGTGEGGYGINPLKGSNLALGFSLNVTDTLNAVDICFNKTNNSDTNDRRYFYLCIWKADVATGKPSSLIYKSDRMLPNADSLNKFTRYVLDEPIVLNPGIFFVSLEIKDKGNYINIAFDRNNDASAFTYSKISPGVDWQQSFIKGALMIRPYFGYKSVGLMTVQDKEKIKIYPNPAQDFIHIEGCDKPSVRVFDLTGRQLLYSDSEILDLSSLNGGVYIINIDGQTQKLIISK
ncbi:MAG: T9SS type A sorting domain-containing protein [Bacteroidales bacterium]|nr:T9SS type A sorting domain-containing protein [Bacteroidales bacterium]